MTALAQRRILGSRGADGRVHAPPFEYDPVTFAAPGPLVPVGPEGTVVSWSWAPEPLEGQPLAHPFGRARGRRARRAGGPGAAGRPAAGASLRVGADPPGRRGHRDAACQAPLIA